jgi:hypothetical protein
VSPQAADGGDGLHMWRVDVSVLSKQPRTVEKEVALEFGDNIKTDLL